MAFSQPENPPSNGENDARGERGSRARTVTIPIGLLDQMVDETRQLLDVVAHFHDGAVGDVFAGALNVLGHRFAPLDLPVCAPSFLESQPIFEDIVAFAGSLCDLCPCNAC